MCAERCSTVSFRFGTHSCLPGGPFFAAGQASAAYPLSALFYILPIEIAFGWFTAIQLAIAGANAYLLGRVLKLRPVAALFSGVAFQFSGFMIVSVVFTMVLAAASWLPLLLATIERMIQKQEEKGLNAFRPIPYVVAGTGIVGLVVLAGHPEFLYYTLPRGGHLYHSPPSRRMAKAPRHSQ